MTNNRHLTVAAKIQHLFWEGAITSTAKHLILPYSTVPRLIVAVRVTAVVAGNNASDFTLSMGTTIATPTEYLNAATGNTAGASGGNGNNIAAGVTLDFTSQIVAASKDSRTGRALVAANLPVFFAIASGAGTLVAAVALSFYHRDNPKDADRAEY